LRSIKDADLKGKRVLLRVDFNVPTDEEGNIIDDSKMRAALPTIEYILNNGARLIVMSHLGRPKGKINEKYSLKKVAFHLGQMLDSKVIMAQDCIGPKVEEAVRRLQPGEILLLENVRFYPGEEKNDSEFSRQLASLAEIYVNDAFGTAHRAHASTAGVADYLPAYAGFLMEKEVEMLRKALEHPEKPRIAILGGAKVSDKIKLIDNLLTRVDVILIGGGMANTFLKAEGFEIGKSICENDLLEEARGLLKLAENRNVQILLPVDVVVTDEISENGLCDIRNVNNIPPDYIIADIGPETVKLFCQNISQARTIVWNGPLGIYEYKKFSSGTNHVAHAVAESNAVSVVGGGDLTAAIYKLGLENKITHVSTGGGATMEFLEGRILPGVAACEGKGVLQR